MKRLTIIFLLLFVTDGFTQKALGVKTIAGLRFNAVSAPVKLAGDGTRSMTLSPMLIGIAVDLNISNLSIPVGIYSSLAVNSETTKDLSLPFFFMVGVYKNLGFGGYYDLWKEGVGVQGFNKETVGLAINYDFSLSNPKREK